MDITIIVPPAGSSSYPPLGAETVAAIARANGHSCEVLHGQLLQPESFKRGFEQSFTVATHFAAYYYGTDPEDEVERLAAVNRDSQGEGEFDDIFVGPYAWSQEYKDYCYFNSLEANHLCETIAETVLNSSSLPQVVGFSIQFDTHKLPAAAVAKALRKKGFGGYIFAGGTAVWGHMGPALLKTFPEFDAVLGGEVEDTLADFLTALEDRTLGEREILGASWRDGSGSICSTQPPQLTDTFLNNPPIDWKSYIKQKSSYSARNEGVLYLAAESSRGCWWGEKHRCTFCSVATEGSYRAKSPAQISAEFADLERNYHPDEIIMTDAVLPHAGMQDLLRALHADRKPNGAEIFYEVKSTYNRRTIARMVDAGICKTQPGIESFSNHSLALMNKGARELQQVNFLKWATAYGMNTVYSILVGSPGETTEDVRLCSDVVNKIGHFVSCQVHPVYYMDGSPYSWTPEGYGIDEVFPLLISSYLYRGGDPDQMSHMHGYSTRREDPEAYHAAVVELKDRVDRVWPQQRRVRTLVRMKMKGGSLIISEGSLHHPPLRFLEESYSRLLDALEEPHSLSSVASKLGIGYSDLATMVSTLEADGLILRDGNYALGLPIPIDASACNDAAWDERDAKEARHFSLPIVEVQHVR